MDITNIVSRPLTISRLDPAAEIEKAFSNTLSKEIHLQTNIVNVIIKIEGPFYMYDVAMEQKTIRKTIDLLMAYRIKRGDRRPFCFDGRRLFTATKWNLTDDVEKFTINNVEISIRLLTTFLKYSKEYFQMINIVFDNIQILMGQVKIGQQFFLDSNCEIDESGAVTEGPRSFKQKNFKFLGGFSTTITRGTHDDGTASTLLCLERINFVLKENSVAAVYRRDQIDQLIGRDIITKWNNKMYRISGIEEIGIYDELIEWNGMMISYYDYFQQIYQITLTTGNQPFVISNEPEDPNGLFIPGELCYLCGFSDSERSYINCELNRKPREMLSDIKDFCKWTSSGKSKDFMKNWTMSYEEQPITISGRELPKLEIANIPNDGKFNVPEDITHRFGDLVIHEDPSHFNDFIDYVKRKIERQSEKKALLVQIFDKLTKNLSYQMESTMIVGFDTYPKTGQRYVQVSVFSINNKCTNYLIYLDFVENEDENIKVINNHLKDGIKQYQMQNRCRPRLIITYGTRKLIKDIVVSSLSSIEDTKENQGEHLPHIVNVFVKNLVRVKFFKNGANANPGTVVDKKIFKPDSSGFYLVSQRTTKGTSSPTYFKVVLDTKYKNKITKENTPMTLSVLQQITYSLCKLFGELPVPVPLYCAHKFAKFINKVNLGDTHPTIDERIKESLFYLRSD